MWRLLVLLVSAWLVASPAASGDLADGLQAYDGGDYAGARKAWKRAAAAGNPLAMTSLANLHMQGLGVPRDPARAAAWYRRAAELGDPVGQLNIGDLLSRGIGVVQDRVEGYMWLGLAAAQGRKWAADRQKALAASMSASEISAAEDRLRTWKPKDG